MTSGTAASDTQSARDDLSDARNAVCIFPQAVARFHGDGHANVLIPHTTSLSCMSRARRAPMPGRDVCRPRGEKGDVSMVEPID